MLAISQRCTSGGWRIGKDQEYVNLSYNYKFASTRSALTGPMKEPAVQALGVPTLQAE